MSWRNRIFPWLLAAASGLALTFCLPPFGQSWLVWFCLIPLFWAVLKAADTNTAANLAAVSGLIFYGISLHWLKGLFGSYVSFAFFCIFALWLVLQASLLWLLWNK